MSGNSEENITEPRVFLPHGQLIVMGEAKCGKTSLVRALTKSKAKERTTRGNSIPTVDVHLVNEQWNSLDFKELLLGDFSWVFWRIFLAQRLYWPLFMELACCGDFRKFERIEQLTKFEIDPFYSWRCRWLNSLNLDNHKVKAGMLVQLLFITALYQLSLWQIVGGWCIVAPVLLMLTTELLRQDPVLLRKKRLEVCSFILIGLIFGSFIVHCWLFNEGGIDYDNTFLILTLLYCICLPHSQSKQSKRGLIPELVSVLSIVQYFAKYDTSSSILRNRLSWDTLAIRRKKQKAVLMYKCLNGLVPNYLQNLFTHRCTSYNLRNQEYKITLPKPRTDFLKRSFSYSGAKLWNDLPLSIRSSSSLAKFKREINLIF